MVRDEKGFVVAAYRSCDADSYEGALDLYCRHLEVVHGCLPDVLDGLRGGQSQGHWLAVDRLHDTYLSLA